MRLAALAGRFLVVLGATALAVGVTASMLQRHEPAFAGSVTWVLALGAGTPLTVAERYRDVHAREDILSEAMRILGGSGGVPASGRTELARRLDLSIGHLAAGGVRISLRVSANTPWAALRTARAVAESVEAWDRRVAPSLVDALMDELVEQIDDLTEQIRVRQVLGGPTADAIVQADLAELDRLHRYRTTLIAFAADGVPDGLLRRRGVSMVSLAPGVPPYGVVAMVASAIIGAALGIAWLRWGAGGDAVGRWFSKRRVGALASLPGGASDKVPAVRLALVEVCEGLLERLAGSVPAVIVVSSPVSMVDKTRIVCLLAEEFVRSSKRTLLVDAVLHDPAVVKRYRSGVDAAHGESGLQVGSTLDWLEDPSREHGFVSVRVVGEGTLDLVVQHRAVWLAPGTAADLFAAMGQLLERWSGYDIVVIDAPPLDADRGAVELASYASGTLLVVKGGGHAKLDPREHAEALRSVEAHLLGIVVVEESDRVR